MWSQTPSGFILLAADFIIRLVLCDCVWRVYFTEASNRTAHFPSQGSITATATQFVLRCASYDALQLFSDNVDPTLNACKRPASRSTRRASLPRTMLKKTLKLHRTLRSNARKKTGISELYVVDPPTPLCSLVVAWHIGDTERCAVMKSRFIRWVVISSCRSFFIGWGVASIPPPTFFFALFKMRWLWLLKSDLVFWNWFPGIPLELEFWCTCIVHSKAILDEMFSSKES